MSERESSVLSLQSSGKKAPRFAWWLATGFGSGYLKPAPGTWGSLAGLMAWLLLVSGMRRIGGAFGPWFLLAAPGLLTLLAVWAASRVVEETGLKDPSFIVIDEWAGLWFALTPLLFTVTVQPQPWLLWVARLVAPFMLFRLLDIWKPGVVDTAQRLPGGWGVVMDDVLAGLLAGLLVWPLDQWLGAQSLAHPALWGK
jgi:phosphatidylglycerophosphatase A